jgi:hypothetical protein
MRRLRIILRWWQLREEIKKANEVHHRALRSYNESRRLLDRYTILQIQHGAEVITPVLLEECGMAQHRLRILWREARDHRDSIMAQIKG